MMRAMRLSIRLKLLVLLLTIGLLPVGAVTWYDLVTNRRLGLELSEQARDVLSARAADRLAESIRDAAEIVRRGRLLLEAEVRLQAREAERALATPAPVGTPVWVPNGNGAPEGLPASPAHNGLPVAFDRFAAAVRADATMSAVGALPRLSAMVPYLQSVVTQDPQRSLWHHVALKGGVHAIYPGRAAQLGADLRELPWYERALRSEGRPVWTLGVDRATGWPVTTVATLLWSPEGLFLGSTAIEVPLSSILGSVMGAGKPHTALLVKPERDAEGRRTLDILAEQAAAGALVSGLVLPADAIPGLSEVIDDMLARQANVRRIWFDGRDSLAAYGVIDDFGTHLLYVAPYDEVVSEAEAAKRYVLDRLDAQSLALLLALLAFVPGLVMAALAASRAVTLPVRQLASMARRLADGDFAARTNIRSGDELEELGHIFNSMVPRLDESIRMRDSLALAMEVQQNLLPQGPPKIAGLDIAGLSIYCDETGGDYFDFLELPEHGAGTVAVAVGDVAGHGISAALLMTTARALLRSHSPEPGKLAGLMEDINRHLVADSHAGRFMTLFLTVLDAERRRVHWVSAGHDPAIIYEPSADSFQEMAGLDIPLGVDAEWHYHELFHSGWSDGTILVIGTDGIWETRNPEGEMFGKEAVRRLIRDNAGLGADALAHAITGAWAAFRGPGSQKDDATLVVIKSV